MFDTRTRMTHSNTGSTLKEKDINLVIYNSFKQPIGTMTFLARNVYLGNSLYESFTTSYRMIYSRSL